MNMSIRKATKRFQKPTYSGLRELDELLSKVPSLEERDQPLRRLLQALDDRFPIFERALRQRLAEDFHRLPIALLPVEDDHALHPDAVHEQGAQVPVAIGLRGVVLRNQPAHHDARIQVHEAKQRIENGAADVLEMHVYAVRTNLP